MNKQDADYIWSLLPIWVKECEDGLDSTFYGTGSSKGDNEVNKKVRKILSLFQKKTTSFRSW